MKILTKEPKFSLTYLLLKNGISINDLPEDLNSFVYDEKTREHLTIAFRCDHELFFQKILVLHYAESTPRINSLEEFSDFGIFQKTGNSEILAEFMLSNLILDTEDPENKNNNKFVRIDGQPFSQKDYVYFDEINNSLASHAMGLEDSIDKTIYTEKIFNNLSYSVDLRNLIPQRSRYPSYDFDDPSPIYGPTRFQYNINQDKLKWWIDRYTVPDFIYQILNEEQKKLLSNEIKDQITSSWQSILKNIFNQEFQIENNEPNRNRVHDSWGSEMYSSLGGDGDENIYLSEGISIRPDGTLTDD
jgi:hypothetical protein